METIQSTNPALMSGTMQEQPRPAGVSAPERLMPMVTSGSQHLFGEELAGFPQTRAVVGKERAVDDVGELLLARQILGQDAFAGKKFLAVGTLLLLHPVRHFGHVFAIRGAVLWEFLAMIEIRF